MLVGMKREYFVFNLFFICQSVRMCFIFLYNILLPVSASFGMGNLRRISCMKVIHLCCNNIALSLLLSLSRSSQSGALSPSLISSFTLFSSLVFFTSFYDIKIIFVSLIFFSISLALFFLSSLLSHLSLSLSSPYPGSAILSVIIYIFIYSWFLESSLSFITHR